MLHDPLNGKPPINLLTI